MEAHDKCCLIYFTSSQRRHLPPWPPHFGFTNFEQSFAPRRRFGLAWKLTKTPFRQFPNFNFSMLKNVVRKCFAFEHTFFSISARFFSSSYVEWDLAKQFPTNFCFRCTYDQLCATRNHEKGSLCRWRGANFFNVVLLSFGSCCNILSISCTSVAVLAKSNMGLWWRVPLSKLPKLRVIPTL